MACEHMSRNHSTLPMNALSFKPSTARVGQWAEKLVAKFRYIVPRLRVSLTSHFIRVFVGRSWT